jgi:hypothetical protein
MNRQPMKAKQKWFAVKTLHRWVPEGRPVKVDRSFDRAGTLVEERILLFRAATPAEAIRIATAGLQNPRATGRVR